MEIGVPVVFPSKIPERISTVSDSVSYTQLDVYKRQAYSKSIKPGVYTLNTSMTPKEMMIVMSGQETQTEATDCLLYTSRCV